MTEAERFLYERLNPPKPNTSVVQTAVVEETSELPSVLSFLSHPTFLRHKVFWSIGFVLMIVLVDLLIMAATDAFTAIDRMSRLNDDHALALIVSFITPITFWIPILVVAQWAWNKKFVKFLAWTATIWMAVIHLCKIGALFTAHGVSAGQILIGIIVFLIGALGIGAIIWNLIAYKRKQNVIHNLPEGKNENDTHTAVLLKRQIAIKCVSCNRAFLQAVSTLDDYVICPNCGDEKHLYEVGPFIKEPLVCQSIRAVFYIFGFFVIISSIGTIFRAMGRDVSYFMGTLGGCALNIALLFGIPSGIKKGAKWTRNLLVSVGGIAMVCFVALKFNHVALIFVILFGGPGLLLFLPKCNAWFAVKTMLRKSREKRKENPLPAKSSGSMDLRGSATVN